jgi:hypothetical protein
MKKNMSAYGFRLMFGLNHSGGYRFTSESGLREVENIHRNGSITRRDSTMINAVKAYRFMLAPSRRGF